MRSSLISTLLYSSLFVLLFSACGHSPYASLRASNPFPVCLNSIKPNYTTVLYDTKVDVIGKHLSGLLLIKKMPDGSTRVVFTNEMGFTLFDFEFFENEFRVLQCIRKLNKKPVLRALRKDIGMILQSGFDYKKVKYFKSDSANYLVFPDGNESYYFITDSTCNSLKRIENSTKRKKKIIVNLTDAGKDLADSVYIAHQAFQFNISLKRINRKDAP